MVQLLAPGPTRCFCTVILVSVLSLLTDLPWGPTEMVDLHHLSRKDNESDFSVSRQPMKQK